MQKNVWVVIVTAVTVAGVALLTGCQSHKPKPQPTDASAGSTTDQSSTSGANSSEAYGSSESMNGGEAAGPTEGQLKNRTIYFDFDSSEIKPEYNDLITAHAKYLAANAGKKVRVEGNTDERGSREYNIGLGERRAQAVRRALMLQGASDNQITTVSYGEERPAVTGHAEESWSRNRRANIVYLN
jgi:peptidoglycan-associated lipoprotein